MDHFYVPVENEICKSHISDRQHWIVSKWESRKELWYMRARDACAWALCLMRD